MFENAKEVIDSILEIVEKCPDQFKEKCFEVLLKGYVDSHISTVNPTPPPTNPPLLNQQQNNQNSLIPPAILQRLQVTAKRLDMSSNQLETLFDFTKDPFNYHAIAIPGDNKAEKTRRVVLVLSFKSYLLNGLWSADWKEIQAMAIDQNCYDRKNHATFIKSNPNLFKDIEAGKNVELTSDGIKEAEKIISILVKGS